MTGSIVGDRIACHLAAAFEFDRFQLLADVTNARAEMTCPLSKLFIAGKQVGIGSQHCSTPTRVGDNGGALMRFLRLERHNVPTGECSRSFKVAGMRMKRSAANLC